MNFVGRNKIKETNYQSIGSEYVKEIYLCLVTLKIFFEYHKWNNQVSLLYTIVEI